MRTQKEITLEISALHSLIEAQMQRMKFLADVRTQPDLLHTLAALNHHHPEIIQQIKQVQSWYSLPILHAMDYLQQTLMPFELCDLASKKHRLESQLKLLEIEPEQEQQPAAGMESLPSAQSRPVETAGSEPIHSAEENMEEELLNTSTRPDRYDTEDALENEDLNALSQGNDSREESNGHSADGSDSSGPDAQEFIATCVVVPATPSDYLA